MITRYVNTASAAGGDGTTNGTAGATRAFHSLAEALAPYSGGSLPDHVVINCSGVAADDGTGGGLSTDHTAWNFTTTTANYLEVFGDNILGRRNTSAYRIEVVNRAGIYNNQAAHVRLYNVQVQVKATDGGTYDIMRLGTANNVLTGGNAYFIYKNCIATQDPTSTSGNCTGFIDSQLGATNLGSCYRINCLAIGCTSSSGGFNVANPGNKFTYNCTAAACTFGYIDNDLTKNCLSTGAVVGFTGTFDAACDYNAEDDGNGLPGTGAHNHSGTVFTFVASASGDYHLASTDTGAKGLGLTDPGSGLYSDDIDGQTRVAPWDIGMDQFVSVLTAAQEIPAFVQQLSGAMIGQVYG